MFPDAFVVKLVIPLGDIIIPVPDNEMAGVLFGEIFISPVEVLKFIS